ncbi:type IV secretory pathway TrbL component [Bradyrhizobium sp. i1.15.2]
MERSDVQPLLDAASQMMGFTSFFANFVQIAVLMVSGSWC